MDAQQWPATVFTPTLDRESLAYTNDAELLCGQLAALYDCDPTLPVGPGLQPLGVQPLDELCRHEAEQDAQWRHFGVDDLQERGGRGLGVS